MRKILQYFLIAVMAFICLTACAGSESTGIYTVDERGTSFTVDTNNMTISDGTNTYHYTVEGSGLRYTTEITYPDGSTYWWTVERSGNFSHGHSTASKRILQSSQIFSVTAASTRQEFILSPLAMNTVSAWKICG